MYTAVRASSTWGAHIFSRYSDNLRGVSQAGDRVRSPILRVVSCGVIWSWFLCTGCIFVGSLDRHEVLLSVDWARRLDSYPQSSAESTYIALLWAMAHCHPCMICSLALMRHDHFGISKSRWNESKLCNNYEYTFILPSENVLRESQSQKNDKKNSKKQKIKTTCWLSDQG